MPVGDSQTGTANGTATNSASEALGNLSNAFGVGSIAIDAVVAAADAINGSLSDLRILLNAISAALAQLQDHIKAEGITQRMATIQSGMSPALSELADLQGNLRKNLTDDGRSRIIDQCTLTMTYLDGVDNPLHADWYAPWQDQVYWNDYSWNPLSPTYTYCKASQDSLAPEPDGTGRVFDYLYILPAYMNALAIFITVAGALDPNFVVNYGGTVILPAVDLLLAWHDKIVKEGIVQLSPEPYMDVPRPHPWSPLPSPVQWTGSRLYWAIAALPLPGPANWLTGVTPGPLGDHTWQARIKYGAVERFSACSAVSTYTIQLTTGFEGPGLPDVNLGSNDPSPYKKFQIRLLKKAKEVYVKAGLLAVWNSVKAVKSLLGRPPLSRPNFADWSFRAIGNVVGMTSLKAIRTFIMLTPPIDTPSPAGLAPVGFRALLEV